MRSIARTLLLCLMVLALPVQAVAAAALWHCGGLHTGAPAQAAAAGLQAPCAGHAMADSALGEPRDDVAHAVHEKPIGAPEPSTGTHHCSACAGCCAAIGLPASAVTLPAAPPQAAAVRAPGAAGESFVPAGLDRPPRAG